MVAYIGTISNGQVVMSKDVELPEGTRVEISPLMKNASEEKLSNGLLRFAAQGENLPVDLAKNHDHYLHGTSRQ